MADPERVMITGSGGATFTVDVPEPGSMAREQFDAQLGRGEIAIAAAPVVGVKRALPKAKSDPEPVTQQEVDDAADQA